MSKFKTGKQWYNVYKKSDLSFPELLDKVQSDARDLIIKTIADKEENPDLLKYLKSPEFRTEGEEDEEELVIET